MNHCIACKKDYSGKVLCYECASRHDNKHIRRERDLYKHEAEKYRDMAMRRAEDIKQNGLSIDSPLRDFVDSIEPRINSNEEKNNV